MPPQQHPIQVVDRNLTLDQNLDILSHWALTYCVRSDSRDSLKISIDYQHFFFQPLALFAPKVEAFATAFHGGLDVAADTFHHLISDTFNGFQLDADTVRRMVGISSRLAIDSLARQGHQPKSCNEGSSYLLNGFFWDDICSDRRAIPGFNTHTNEWRSLAAYTAHLIAPDRRVSFDSGLCDGGYYCTMPEKGKDATIHFDRLGMLSASTKAACVLGMHEVFHGILTGEAVDYIKRWEPEWSWGKIVQEINSFEDVRVTAASMYVTNNPKYKPRDLYDAHSAFLVSYMRSLDPADANLLPNEIFYLSIREGLGTTVPYNTTSEAQDWLKTNRHHIQALANSTTIPLGSHGLLNLESRNSRREECALAAAEHLHALVTSCRQQGAENLRDGPNLGPQKGLNENISRRFWGAPPEKPEHEPSPLEKAADTRRELEETKGQSQEVDHFPVTDNKSPTLIAPEMIIWNRRSETTAIQKLLSQHNVTIREMTRIYQESFRNAKTQAVQANARSEGNKLHLPGYLRHTHIDRDYDKIFSRKPRDVLASTYTFHLVVDSSQSMYPKTINPAVTLLSVQMVSLLNAGHRVSLSAFAQSGEVLIPTVKSFAEAKPFLEPVLAKAFLGEKIHQSTAMKSGTEAYYSLRAPLEVIRQTPEVVGPQAILIFSDGGVSNNHSEATASLLQRCRTAHIPVLFACYPAVSPSVAALVGNRNCLALPDLSLATCKELHGHLLATMKNHKLLVDVAENKRTIHDIRRLRQLTELTNATISHGRMR